MTGSASSGPASIDALAKVAPPRPLGAGWTTLTIFGAFVAGQIITTGVLVVLMIGLVLAGSMPVRELLSPSGMKSVLQHPLTISVGAVAMGATLLSTTYLVTRLRRMPFRFTANIERPRAVEILLAVLIVMSTGPFADAAINGFKALFPGVTLGALEGFHEAAQSQGPAVLVLFFAISVVPGIAEEVFFRGVVQRSFVARLGPAAGITAASVAFGAFHVDPPQAIGAAFLGLALGFIAWRTNSVVPSMVAHAGNNLLALVSSHLAGPGALDEPTEPIVFPIAGAILAITGGLLFYMTRAKHTKSIAPPTAAALGLIVLACPWLSCASTSNEPTGSSPDAPPDKPLGSITIVLTNLRKETIYVQNQNDCKDQPVEISSTEKKLELFAQSNDCDTAKTGGCVTFGDCPGAGVFILPPGESMTMKWNGAAIQWKTIEKPAEHCPSSCTVESGVPAASYKLRAYAWGKCTGDCKCGTDLAGTRCDRPKSLSLKPDLTVELPLNFPGTQRVELAFRP